MPVNVDQENIRHFNINRIYDCPDCYVYHFKSIHLLSDGTLFVGIKPLALSFPYYKKRIPSQSCRSIASLRIKGKKNKLKSRNGAYLAIHDQWTTNYYHWITQAIPRLILAQKLDLNFVLLLPQNHTHEFHISSLRFFGVYNWVPLLDNLNYYEVDNLLYPTHDIQIGDYSEELIREIAGRIRKASSRIGTILLFVHRSSKNKRRIINEDSVLATFVSFGFKIVEFELLSFDEQVIICGKASLIAGVHGAGLTNMIFMQPGSKVLELTTRLDGNQYYYYTLSCALGHNYYYQLCRSDDEATTVQDSNILVDIESLKGILSGIIEHGR